MARPALSRELLVVWALFLVLTLGMVSLTWAGLFALSAVRAYVAGEGFYSKAQKDAVHHLDRYALTRDEADYRRYLAAIAVPRADAAARVALEQGVPDLDAARRAFLEARNHPQDVPGLALLFRHAGWFPEMREAIEIWRAGDRTVASLHEVAQSLRAELSKPDADEGRLRAMLAAVDELNAELGELEDRFSLVLGQGARRMRGLAMRGSFAGAAALLAIVIFASTRALRQLSRSEASFRALIEHGHDLITVLDARGTIEYASPALERVLGYRPEELVGASGFLLLHPSDQERAAVALARLETVRDTPFQAEYRFRHKEGRWRVLAVTGAGFGDASEPPRVVVHARDVTEQRSLESERNHSQRMESIGRLAGGIAHDFNNLLTVMLGSVEVARHEAAEGSSLRRDLDRVWSAGRRAADLTRQLLAFASRQVIEPRVFDLNETVRNDTRSLLERLLGEPVALSISLASEPAWVRADPGQIHQILVNLAVNARDAMPDGGVLSIRVEPVFVQADSAEAQQAGGLVGRLVRLDVEDTGVAMSEEVLQHIFEPFFTTKKEGHGLGLATCYGIVNQSGGSITVSSRPQSGTRFRIHLPRAEAPATAEHPVQPAIRPRRATILVVEDEDEVRRIAVLALRRVGHRVLECRDGEGALEIARDEGPIDLLVTDVVMPGMGGRELAERLRKGLPDVRVLFVSGYAADEVLRRTIQDAGLDFLPKPFGPVELQRKVAEILDGAIRPAR
jgi:PAS domain S-box-containing protein